MLKRTKPTSPTPPSSGIESDDKKLLTQALQGVTPLAVHNQRLVGHLPRPHSNAQQQRKREAAQHQTNFNASLFNISDGHLSPDASPVTQYSISGVSTVTLQKLKRGFWPVTASLDLHGMTVDTARTRLSMFIQQAQHQDMRCVRVVHGQGLGSVLGHGRLKHHSRHWLAQMAGVNAFIEAPSAQGGAGAVLVLLGRSG